MTGMIQNDEPTTADTLDRTAYAEALANVLKTCETPLVVGLFGTWGIGKTSLMRQVEATVVQKVGIRTVWFDPWQHQFDEDPAVALLHTMVDQLDLGEEGRKLLTVIAGALGSIVLNATTTIGTSDIKEIGEQYEAERFQVREKQIRLRKHFGELIHRATNGGERRLVFFVDDLDRCVPDQILKVLESLKLYLNLPGCVYVLGVDRSALEASIKQRYKDLDMSEADYLDKIVQLPFSIPPIARESMEAFISPLLSEDLGDVVPLLGAGLGDNPRQVKRFVNALLLNHQLASQLVGNQYDPKRLVGVLLVQYRQPDLFKKAIGDPRILVQLVGNPDGEAAEILKNDPALAEVVGLAGFDDPQELSKYIYLSEVASVREVDFDVVMLKSGDKKIQLIKFVMSRAGLGLKEAKELVESLPPVTLASGLTREDAEEFCGQLRGIGCEVAMQ